MISLPQDDLDRPPTEQATTPIRWPKFRAELLALYSPPMVAAATARKVKSVLGEIDRLGIETTADLSPVMISRYISMRPADQSPHTLHSLLCVIRAICSYAETAGYLRCSPFRLRKLSRWVRLPPLQGKRHFSKAEISLVLKTMAQDVELRSGWGKWRARRLQIATCIVAYTGMRKNECLRLHVGDVDLAAGVIFIRPHGDGQRLKTVSSEAPVPTPQALRERLVDWLEHRLDSPTGFDVPMKCPWLIPTCDRKSPWTSGAPGGKFLDRLKAVAKRVGIEGMTVLSLRHSLATHLEAHGAGPAAISRILRHTNTRTAEKHYRHWDTQGITAITSGFEY